MGTGLNSTTRRLIESVALLTKVIGIVTPLILSIVVVVALRLISYRSQLQDHIVQRLAARSYRTRDSDQICIIHGLRCKEEKKKERGSPTCLCSR